MGADYIEDVLFDQASRKELLHGAVMYDNCRFLHLDLSAMDFSGAQFIDCRFEHCNLSGVKLLGTSFRDVVFSQCKMIGVHFEDCHAVFFDAVFRECNLDLSSFFKRKLAGKAFTGCSLRETDFTEADLGGVSFAGADLHGAIFDQCNLEKADFREAAGYALDPERNRVKKARFGIEGLSGLLGKYDLSIE